MARVLKPTKKDQNREPPPNAGGERPPNRGAPGCLNFRAADLSVWRRQGPLRRAATGRVRSRREVWTRQLADLDANNPETFQEIGQHIANGLRNRGRSDDAPPDVLNESDPVGLTLRGWRDLDCRKSMDDVYRARGRFELALRHDGESVIALNGLAPPGEGAQRAFWRGRCSYQGV
jgi:hypothetical protein